MADNRVFADFYDGALPFQMSRIPEGGMCLSVFLVIWKGSRRNVLLGHIDTGADWQNIGALGGEYAEKVKKGWMLPSSHLVLYESPQEAVARVLKEQLSLDWTDIMPEPLRVYSEVYTRYRHWDIEFVQAAELVSGRLFGNSAWSALEFRDQDQLEDKSFARNHQDILKEAGFRQ